MNTRQYIETNRAAIFDWSVIFISFMLGFAFPTMSDFIRSDGFFYWLVTGLFLYIVGAVLKHLPLSYRMSFSSHDPKPVPYTMFLIVGHWFIFLIVFILCEGVFRKMLDLPAMTDKNGGGWEMILAACLGAAMITWLAYRTKSKRKNRKKYSDRFLFTMEFVADLLLVAGVSILSFVFWEKGVMGMLVRAKTETIGDIWFLFVFLAILYLFFYLPLRYLYFVEDRKAGANRNRLLFIFGFLLLRALIEMLTI